MARESAAALADEEAIRAKLREAGWDKKRLPKAPAQGEAEGERRGARASRRDRERSRSRARRDSERERRGARSSRHRTSRRRSRSRTASRSRSRSRGSRRHHSSKRSRRSSRSASTPRKSRRREEPGDKKPQQAEVEKDKDDKRGKQEKDKPAKDDGETETENDEEEKLDKESGKTQQKQDKGQEKADKERAKTHDKGDNAPEKSDKEGGASASHKKARKSSRRSRTKSRSQSRSSRHRRRRSHSRSRSTSRSRRSRRASSRSRSRSRSRRDRDRDRRRRDRSASRSRSRSRRHHRSSSRDRKRRDSNASSKATEVPPAPTPAAPEAPVNPSITQLMQQYPTLSLQEIIAKMQAASVTMAAAAATKPARELYVGNLPANITGPQLQEFLSTIIQQVGLTTQPGNPIVNTWLSADGHFAFCEMRTVEECNLALLLNQLPLLGQPLKFGRPKSFVGPPQPLPAVSARTQTALVNLGCTPNPMWFTTPVDTTGALLGAETLASASIPGVTVPASSPTASQLSSSGISNKLVMMNIPIVLNEDQVKELVEPFGKLRSFSLVKDTVGGAPTASALFEYEDASVTDDAANGLNGLDIGGIPLSVRRESASSSAGSAETSSPVVRMANMVSAEELKDDEEFADLAEDVEEECKRFGTIAGMEIPRPKEGQDVPGVGNIFVRFENASEAAAAIKALSGRKFGGNIVHVSYYPVSKFEAGEFA